MKRLYYVMTIVLCFAACLCGCAHEEVEAPGRMKKIVFEPNDFKIDSEETTIIAHASKGGWIVKDAKIEDEMGTRIYFGLDKEVYTLEQDGQYQRVEKADFEEWFTYIRPSGNNGNGLEIQIHIDKNNSGKSRRLTLGFDGGVMTLCTNIVIEQEGYYGN